MSHLIVDASEVRPGDITDILGVIDLKVISSGPADHLLLGVSSRDLATLQRITLLGVGGDSGPASLQAITIYLPASAQVVVTRKDTTS